MHRGRGQRCSVGAQQWDKGRWAQNKTQAGLCCEVPGEVGGGRRGGSPNPPACFPHPSAVCDPQHRAVLCGQPCSVAGS